MPAVASAHPDDLTSHLRTSLRDTMGLVADKAATAARHRASIDILDWVDADALSARDLALVAWAAELGRREGMEVSR